MTWSLLYELAPVLERLIEIIVLGLDRPVCRLLKLFWASHISLCYAVRLPVLCCVVVGEKLELLSLF